MKFSSLATCSPILPRYFINQSINQHIDSSLYETILLDHLFQYLLGTLLSNKTRPRNRRNKSSVKQSSSQQWSQSKSEVKPKPKKPLSHLKRSSTSLDGCHRDGLRDTIWKRTGASLHVHIHTYMIHEFFSKIKDTR